MAESTIRGLSRNCETLVVVESVIEGRHQDVLFSTEERSEGAGIGGDLIVDNIKVISSEEAKLVGDRIGGRRQTNEVLDL